MKCYVTKRMPDGQPCTNDAVTFFNQVSPFGGNVRSHPVCASCARRINTDLVPLMNRLAKQLGYRLQSAIMIPSEN